MIRLATANDLPRMVEMGLRFLEESPYKKYFARNPGKMLELGERLLASAGGILVAQKDQEIVAMLGFIVHEHFISGERVAGEVFWWVEPEHRGAGLRLLREAEKEAKARGAVNLQMIAPDERVGKLYGLLGYEFLESTHQKSLL